jgi:hypothetical protein
MKPTKFRFACPICQSQINFGLIGLSLFGTIDHDGEIQVSSVDPKDIELFCSSNKDHALLDIKSEIVKVLTNQLYNID